MRGTEPSAQWQEGSGQCTGSPPVCFLDGEGGKVLGTVAGWHSPDVTGLRKERLKCTFWKVGLQTDGKSGSVLEVIGRQVPGASKAQGFLRQLPGRTGAWGGRAGWNQGPTDSSRTEKRRARTATRKPISGPHACFNMYVVSCHPSPQKPSVAPISPKVKVKVLQPIARLSGLHPLALTLMLHLDRSAHGQHGYRHVQMFHMCPQGINRHVSPSWTGPSHGP